MVAILTIGDSASQSIKDDAIGGLDMGRSILTRTAEYGNLQRGVRLNASTGCGGIDVVLPQNSSMVAYG